MEAPGVLFVPLLWDRLGGERVKPPQRAVLLLTDERADLAEQRFVSTADWFEVDLRIAYNDEIREYAHQRGLVAGGVDNVNVITEQFDDAPSNEEYAAFHADIHRWIHSTHEISPLQFAYTCELIEPSLQYQPWLERSIPRIPNIVPRLTNLFHNLTVEGGSVVLENISLQIAALYAESGCKPTSEQCLKVQRMAQAAIGAKTGVDPHHWNEPLAKLGLL